MSQILSLEDIKQNYKNGDVAQAYQQVQEYLQRNHDDLQAIKFYQKLKTAVYRLNLKKVKDSIKNVNFMWKQKRYKDLLHLYLQLRQYAPNYAPLQKLIQKASKYYQAEIKTQQGNSDNTIIQNVEGYLKTKNYTQALQFLEEAIKKDLNNPLFQKLLIETKRKIIDSKLKANKRKLKQISIANAHDFIKKLYELEPTYYKIQKLYSNWHLKLKDYYKNSKSIYEKEAKLKIKILFNTKEYEKALRASQELQKVNNKSKTARQFLKKIEEAIDRENFVLAYKKLKT